MPFTKSLASVCYTLLAVSISLNSKIMDSCSHYIRKGLVCIILTAPFSCQPSSCSKWTKLNTCSSYNIYLMSNNKFFFYLSISPSPTSRWKYLVVYSIFSSTLSSLKPSTSLSKLSQGLRFNLLLKNQRVSQRELLQRLNTIEQRRLRL